MMKLSISFFINRLPSDVHVYVTGVELLEPLHLPPEVFQGAADVLEIVLGGVPDKLGEVDYSLAFPLLARLGHYDVYVSLADLLPVGVFLGELAGLLGGYVGVVLVHIVPKYK